MNKLIELYYTVVGRFMLWTARRHLMKSVHKTLKDRHAMREALDDRERIQRAVYHYHRMADRDGVALEESRACRD